ncbi:ABC transporter substrate-binding protein [Butyrivibrio sp. VCD2006]|uniref:ABC transporter substrate-binding protein n=1 Tax=Butyrivibrio sp. VCD2006 TaxID=1280664 RepID=UPI000428F87C|nr:ABC transporter substrate-binding protein [Butyrivibrio sp. VCD2006]
MEKRREIFLFIKSTMLFLLITVFMAGCGGISDGEYAASVTLSGGSGRAYIESPCKITIENGKATADIFWSSRNYDYMIVDGETYYPVNTDGNSEFIIPVKLDEDMAVKADTVAMSTPHLIEYTLRFSIISDGADAAKTNASQGARDEADAAVADNMDAPEISGLTYVSTDENDYASCFAIHRYSKDYSLICVDDGRKYLIVPEDEDESGLDVSGFIVLKRPLNRVYLAASSVMCQYDALSAIDDIILSGLDRDGWYIESAVQAMDEGRLVYGGKYSAPDYEKMVMDEVNLAIENTMIFHTPKVQEKIEQLGIPVFIDRSSYEPWPLGRCEWVRVYGLISGKEKEAAEAFEEQKKLVEALSDIQLSDKTVAVFSVNSNHQIVTRKINDYFSKMIEKAGGSYIAPGGSDDGKANSQITISTEEFYNYAENADILIYNATIEDEPESLQSLMDMDITFKNFKAFKEGKVYFTDKALYQYAYKTGTIIDSLNKIIVDDVEDTEFFHKLK